MDVGHTHIHTHTCTHTCTHRPEIQKNWGHIGVVLLIFY